MVSALKDWCKKFLQSIHSFFYNTYFPMNLLKTPSYVKVVHKADCVAYRRWSILEKTLSGSGEIRVGLLLPSYHGKICPLNMNFYSNLWAAHALSDSKIFGTLREAHWKKMYLNKNLKVAQSLTYTCTDHKGTFQTTTHLQLHIFTEANILKTPLVLPRSSPWSLMQLLIPSSLRDCIWLTV